MNPLATLSLALLVAGCTLHSSSSEPQPTDDTKPGDDDDEIPSPGGPGNDPGPTGAGPVGRTFTITRDTPIQLDARCPRFPEELDAHDIEVVSEFRMLIDGTAAPASVISTEPAVEGRDPANLIFQSFEDWTSSEGDTRVEVQYTLFVAGDTVTGTASTRFEFRPRVGGSHACGVDCCAGT